MYMYMYMYIYVYVYVYRCSDFLTTATAHPSLMFYAMERRATTATALPSLMSYGCLCNLQP